MAARTVSIWTSSLAGDRLERGEARISAAKGAADIALDPTNTFQTMEGFGGSFNEAGWYALLKVSPSIRRGVLRKLFDSETGAGFTLCRTPIGSSDFGLDAYSYAETPGDFELKDFTIERDRKYLIPYIKAAKEVNPSFKLLASPWSAPAWMKTNNDREHGGELKPECYPAYAEYFVKYIRAYAKEGIPIEYITVQNEVGVAQTFDSMVWSAEQTTEFVKNHLGPAFEREGIATKILMYDHNRDNWEYPVKVLNDPGAAKYLYGTAVHGYDWNLFENISRIHDARPDKVILFTEMSHGHVPNYSFKDGEDFGWQMVNDINNWCASWIYWNAVLNEKGGPSHDTWAQDALAIVNEETGDVGLEGEYYYLAHFSKFVHPGAKRIGAKASADKALATAFAGADGKTILVAINKGEDDVEASVSAVGEGFSLQLPAHGIVTAIW